MTRAFALEACGVALANAERFALAAGLDQSVVSEVRHLRGVVDANKEDEGQTTKDDGQ